MSKSGGGGIEMNKRKAIAVIVIFIIIALFIGTLIILPKEKVSVQTKVPSSEQKPTVTPTPKQPTNAGDSTIVFTTSKSKCDIETVSDIPLDKMFEPISLEKLSLEVKKDSIKGWTSGANAVVASKIRGYKKRVGQEVSVEGIFSKFYYTERGRIHSLENVSAYNTNGEIKVYRSFLEGKGMERLEIAFYYKEDSVVAVGYGVCVNLDYINSSPGGDGGGDSDGGGPGPDPDNGGGPGPDPTI